MTTLTYVCVKQRPVGYPACPLASSTKTKPCQFCSVTLLCTHLNYRVGWLLLRGRFNRSHCELCSSVHLFVPFWPLMKKTKWCRKTMRTISGAEMTRVQIFSSDGWRSDGRAICRHWADIVFWLKMCGNSDFATMGSMPLGVGVLDIFHKMCLFHSVHRQTVHFVQDVLWKTR